MPGRHARPVALHLAEGNPSHLTKAEIKARQEAEIKLGENDLSKLRMPAYVRKDKTAAKLWRELIKEYKSAAAQGVELLTSADVGLLGRYCKTFSEYERLLESHQRIEKIAEDTSNLNHFIQQQEDFVAEAMSQLAQLASIDGILKVERAINQKMDQLVKMEDRLFLNPLAKVKNIPKQAKEPAKKSGMAKFLERRSAAGGGHAT